jgi:hypothetical protein
MTARIAATLVLTALSPLVAPRPASADVHPCDLVRRADVASVLHWTYTGRQTRTYQVARASGSICTLQAKEGSIVVTVPDHGASFLANNDLVDPFYNGYGRRYAIHGAVMQLYNDTAYVKRNGRTAAVQALPNSGAPTPDDVIALGTLVAHRLP